MARITIAIPARNEAALLAGALENLRRQSFSDFEAIVYDNASDDDTPRVAKEMAARDPRFSYVRRSENIGALRNFHESLLAASSPFFLWRACDDQCGDNYLAVLAALLDADAEKVLAVGAIDSSDLDGGNARRFDFAGARGGTRAVLRARAAMIYGLFRREPLTRRMNDVMSEYGEAFGFDYLVLLPFIFDEQVAASNATTFRQIKKRLKRPGAARRGRGPAELDRMISLRRRFYACARTVIAARAPSLPARMFHGAVLWIFTGKRLFGFRKVVLRMLTRG